jgi:hypothetical protein
MTLESTIINIINKNRIKIKNKYSNDIILGKIYNNKIACQIIGNIWQEIFTLSSGWNSHKKGIDLINEDKKIVMELKNRYNTCNSSSKKFIINRLLEFQKENKEYSCVYAYINCESINNEGVDHIVKGIRYLTGNKLLHFMFGDKYKNIVRLLKKHIKNIYKNE